MLVDTHKPSVSQTSVAHSKNACGHPVALVGLSRLAQAKAIEKQIQAARERDESRGDASGREAGPTELQAEDGRTTLRIGLGTAVSGTAANGGGSSGPKRPRLAGVFSGESGDGGDQGTASLNGQSAGFKRKAPGKRSALEIVMEQDQKRKAAKAELEALEAQTEAEANEAETRCSQDRKDYWLQVGLVVKVLNKKVGGGKYYKKKARVRKVVEKYIGEVKMLESGDRLRVDQDDLETVRPQVEQKCPRVLDVGVTH